MTLTRSILLGLGLGIIIGIFLPEAGSALSVLSVIFVRLLQMLVVPLVFSNLVVGIAGAKGGDSFKWLLIRAVIFFALATTVAAVIGIVGANLLEPGVRSGAKLETQLDVNSISDSSRPPFVETLIPTSVVQAMSRNNLIALVLFTVAFGFALRSVADQGNVILKGCESLAAVMFRMTGYVMWVAPFGVMGATASTVAQTGWEGMRPFLALLITAYAAEACFVLLFFVSASLIAGFSLIGLLKTLRDALLLAFTTASGAAALPVAMERLKEWGASHRIVSFVLPLGYSFNLTGIALYLPMVTIFWAQFNNIRLSWEDQFVLLVYVLIVIRGIPSVPRGFFLVWAVILTRLVLPPEGLLILLAVDPLIDMARTVVNVGGNCLAVAVLDRWAKERK